MLAAYRRLLFARVGIPHCPNCGKRIEAQTVQQIVDRVRSLAEGTRLSVLAPICRARRGELKLELERLRRLDRVEPGTELGRVERIEKGGAIDLAINLRECRVEQPKRHALRAQQAFNHLGAGGQAVAQRN